MTKLHEARRVILAADLTGYTKAVHAMDALELATMLERYYAGVTELVGKHGGRIVKFMGDGFFAVFEDGAGVPAVACGKALEAYVRTADLHWNAQLGVHIHASVVAEGTLGGQFDVVGAGVNFAFRMGGYGLSISEPVYRMLPDEVRGEWKKEKPPAVYRLQ
jgi:class 3 adenylate cyclase